MTYPPLPVIAKRERVTAVTAAVASDRFIRPLCKMTTNAVTRVNHSRTGAAPNVRSGGRQTNYSASCEGGGGMLLRRVSLLYPALFSLEKLHHNMDLMFAWSCREAFYFPSNWDHNKYLYWFLNSVKF